MNDKILEIVDFKVSLSQRTNRNFDATVQALKQDVHYLITIDVKDQRLALCEDLLSIERRVYVGRERENMPTSI